MPRSFATGLKSLSRGSNGRETNKEPGITCNLQDKHSEIHPVDREALSSTKPVPRKRPARRRVRKPTRLPHASLSVVARYLEQVSSPCLTGEEASVYVLNSPSPGIRTTPSVHCANWSSTEDLFSCRDLPPHKRVAIENAVFKAEELFPYAFQGTYLKDLGLIVMADLENWKGFCYCQPFVERPKGHEHRNWKCRNYDFCPHCCWLRASGDLNRFTEASERELGRLYALTLSFNQSIVLGDDLDLMLAIFDMLEALVRDGFAAGLFSGALFTKELAITQLSPVRGIVHAHVLLHGGHPLQIEKQLKQRLLSSDAWNILLERKLVPPDFRPDFDLRTPKTEVEVRNWPIYAGKVFSIAKAYEAAYDQTAPDQRWSLNCEAAQLLCGWDLEMTRDVREIAGVGAVYRTSGRVFRLGTCTWQAKNSITTPKKLWKDPEHLEKVDAIRIVSKQEAKTRKLFREEEDYLSRFPVDTDSENDSEQSDG